MTYSSNAARDRLLTYFFENMGSSVLKVFLIQSITDSYFTSQLQVDSYTNSELLILGGSSSLYRSNYYNSVDVPASSYSPSNGRMSFPTITFTADSSHYQNIKIFGYGVIYTPIIENAGLSTQKDILFCEYDSVGAGLVFTTGTTYSIPLDFWTS